MPIRRPLRDGFLWRVGIPWGVEGVGLQRHARSRANEASKEAFDRVAELELKAAITNGRRLAFPQPSNPRLTVLLVVYNAPALTLRCLESLSREMDPAAEVLVVDNASGPATREVLDRLDGARVVRNRDNLHFLEGVNAALPEARGDYVLLLNNDVVLLPGALRRALETAESDPSLGAVGGQVVSVDGRLLEAGCEILGDGTCQGVRRGQDPTPPDQGAPQEVDYVSGCFLLTPLARMQESGGLDRRYTPAYYEDVDFCTGLWNRGWRVVCDPGVQVLHYESAGSSPYEIAERVLRNRRLFCAKHDWQSAHQAREDPAYKGKPRTG